MVVAVQLAVHDALHQAAKNAVLRSDLQRAVLHLLQDVRLAVRPVDVDEAEALVDQRLVVLQAERLPDSHEAGHGLGLGAALDVEVARVEPPADRQAGDPLARLEGRVGACHPSCSRRSAAR